MGTSLGAGDRTEPSPGPNSTATLLPLVYSSLRRLAERRLAREKGPQTLQPTALVHEAYLRLLRDGEVQWANQAHFFASAAEAMRRILVERARRLRRAKHGGRLERTTYDEQAIPDGSQREQLLFLDAALGKLERVHPRKARVVKLRYFGGFTIDETARMLEISPATVKLDWTFARAWIEREIAGERSASLPPDQL